MMKSNNKCDDEVTLSEITDGEIHTPSSPGYFFCDSEEQTSTAIVSTPSKNEKLLFNIPLVPVETYHPVCWGLSACQADYHNTMTSTHPTASNQRFSQQLISSESSQEHASYVTAFNNVEHINNAMMSVLLRQQANDKAMKPVTESCNRLREAVVRSCSATKTLFCKESADDLRGMREVSSSSFRIGKIVQVRLGNRWVRGVVLQRRVEVNLVRNVKVRIFNIFVCF
jgi:hypothetical protein